MYYLITCDTDKSLCVVEDFEVVQDIEQPTQLEEKVEFFYGKEKFTGTVVDISANENSLKEKAKQLKRKRKAPSSSVQNVPLPPKRPQKPKKSFSFTDESNNSEINKLKNNPEKKKKENYTKNLQEQVKSRIREENKVTVAEVSNQHSTVQRPLADDTELSPSKEELKIMLEKQKKLLASYRSSLCEKSAMSSKILQKRDESSFDDTDEESPVVEKSSASEYDNDEQKVSKKDTIGNSDKKDDVQSPKKSKKGNTDTQDVMTLNPQLWGKDCGEPVVMLKNNIYCKKAIFDEAEDLCRKSATSFLRRLMDGVFKTDVLLNLNCTFSGRPPSAQGKNKQLEKVVPIDRIAKKALIEYCSEYATRKGWSKSNPADLGTAMSQWIGELKREHRKNLERNT